MIRVLPMPIANYRIDGKDLFTEHQMQAYTIECQESKTPQREWQGLTDEEERQCRANANASHYRHVRSIRGQQLSPADDWEWHFIRAIEAKLKEKNA